jgi:hypothetical protein
MHDEAAISQECFFRDIPDRKQCPTSTQPHENGNIQALNGSHVSCHKAAATHTDTVVLHTYTPMPLLKCILD